MVLLLAPIVIVVCLVRLDGQSPQAPEQKPLAFEVASVKPNKSVGANTLNGFALPGDRLEVTNATVASMVSVAYGKFGPPMIALANYQIVGGPDWIRSDRFDVSARVGQEIAVRVGAAQKLLMFRTLLKERFSLTVHEVTREGPIYVLGLASSNGKLGPQLHSTSIDCPALFASAGALDRDKCSSSVAFAGSMRARGQTMADLVTMFSKFMDRPVVDRTGLMGAFDLDLDFNPDGTGLPTLPGPQRSASDKPPIFTAVQEQLGLKLESTKGPVDVLVIDHVEKPTQD